MAADGASPRDRERERLARQVIDLARGEIVADHPFLSEATGLLRLRLSRMGRKFSTDGRTLWADPGLVVADFVRTGRAPTHDLLHVVLHCLLLHPFVGEGEDVSPKAWSLATDIVVERLAAELLGPREGERGRAVSAVVEQLRHDLDAEPTAERVYRALRHGRYANVRRTWQQALEVDDPRRWFPRQDDHGEEQGEGSEDPQGTSQQAPRPSEPEDDRPRDGQPDEGSSGGDFRDGLSGAEEAAGALQDAEGEEDPSLGGARPLSARERDDARERWRRAARSVRVDLETLSRSRGEQLGDLTRELAVSQHRRQDLREFLRRFATLQEDVHVSPDEFDYVFYTLGLELFGDTPLIEPLEYREVRAIRDFVIVIDTSGSVEGPAVQRFVDTAFDVLTERAAFATRTNVHVIQADAGVQEDVRISSPEDLERWRHGFVLKGLGGTDFRPAIAYVERLREEGEFDDLAGLIYLTDGWGTYPAHAPGFRCAFVFYDEDHEPERVPPWAITLTLTPDDLDRACRTSPSRVTSATTPGGSRPSVPGGSR